MNNFKPKITIILATYNRSHLIGETLDSFKRQTYSNWECIIVDDNSIDNTEEVVNSYLQKDNRFLYYRKPIKYRKGLSGTRNYGLDLAFKRGVSFIQLFDDDDIMHPKKLELQIEPLLKDPSVDLTICCYRKFGRVSTIEYDLEKANDQSCNIHTHNLLKSFFINEINLNSPGPLWKAKILENYRFNENLLYAEEREYYLRIFLNEHLKYVPVEKILFWYRKHINSITSSNLLNHDFKEESMQLFRDVFFNEILNHNKAPFYLLKFYVAHGVREKKENITFQIASYLLKNYFFLDLKYFLLFLTMKFRFMWKIK